MGLLFQSNFFFETLAASVELENSNEGQLQMEWTEQNTHQDEEVREEQLGSQQSQIHTVLKLSFGEDQSFSRAPFGDDQNMSALPAGDEQSLLESAYPEEETGEVSKVAEQEGSEVFSFEEVGKIDGYSYSEEDIEPSTDEELRLWTYPQDKVGKKRESIIAEEQEKAVCAKEEEGESYLSTLEKVEGGDVADSSEPSDNQDGERYLGNVSAAFTDSSEMQDDEKPRPEEDKLESTLNRDKGNRESCEGCHEGAVTGDVDVFTIKQDQKDIKGCTHKDDVYQQSEVLTVSIKEEDMDLESDSRGLNSREKEREAFPFADVTQTEYPELETNLEDVAKPKVETQAESSDIDGSDGAQCLPEVQVSSHLLETEEMEQDADAVDNRQGVVDGLREKTQRAEGGESTKKVTFILEPELINDSTLSETNTSMESRAETSMSGENTKM